MGTPTPSRLRTPAGDIPAGQAAYNRQRGQFHADQPVHPVPPIDLPDRTWPIDGHHQGAAVVRGRPAGRQPGADRPDDPGPQAPDVRPAGRHGLQGDRGRLPGRQPDRLRLRPGDHRAGRRPVRRPHPGADPGPAGADRPHLRGRRGRAVGAGPPVQLHLHPAAPGGVRPGPQGHHPDRHRRRRGGRPLGGEVPGHRLAVRVLPRVLHRHRTGVRGRGLQRGLGDLAADRAEPDGGQPAGHRRDGHPERLRRLHRVDAPQPGAAQRRSCCRCTRTTTAAPRSPPPSWATWPAPTGSRAACSATASGPATSAW